MVEVPLKPKMVVVFKLPFSIKNRHPVVFLFLFPIFFWEKLMMIEMIYKMVCKSDTIEDMLGYVGHHFVDAF